MQSEWGSETSLQLQPQIADPGLLDGQYLKAVQRCSALDLWDASKKLDVHLACTYTEDIDIVAVTRIAERPLDIDAARLGVAMLKASGEALEALMLEANILQDVEVASAASTSLRCTFLASVLKHFVDIVYVFVRKSGSVHPMCSSWASDLCTCAAYCHYSGCEHVEYVKFVNLRCRPRERIEHAMPVPKRRSRRAPSPRSRTGRERAAAKEKAKGKTAGKGKGKAEPTGSSRKRQRVVTN